MSNSIRDETPDQDTNSGGRAAPRRWLRAEDLRFLFLEGIVVRSTPTTTDGYEYGARSV